jgi:predicted ATPase
VGGESGVGKSRLLEELRAVALVKGAMVVRGQSVSGGGKLYGLWRPVLRWLCIALALDDEEAAILKILVPDIPDLLGREIPDPPPEPNPQAAQERLFRTIEGLFRHCRPIVVILEDLQWTGESLDILTHLKPVAPELPC